MSRRRTARVFAALTGFFMLAGLAVALPSPDSRASAQASSACAIPHQWLVRTWRGFRPDRSPEVQILPTFPDFLGDGYPHVGPWPYVQDVPMLWYGPGYIRPNLRSSRPVSLVDIAPTQAELLGFPFRPADGRPMTEALVPPTTRTSPPKLIVTMVWDAGGRNVLSTWPQDWPYLRSLIPRGAWFAHASVGSSPSSTAQDHVNIGTGNYPRNSGIIGHHMRIGNGIFGPFVNGPDLLIAPTLADLYDRSRSNEPLIGEVATVNIHLGMIGHGSMWGGGDGDFLVLRELVGASTQGAEGVTWNIPPGDARYFQYTGWVKELPPLENYFGYADRIDGTDDGLWRGEDIAAQKGGFDTPARVPAQTRIIEELIRREGFGADATPDMLMINYKLIDEIGHIWTMNSPQMSDSVRAQDGYLRRLVEFLNRQVGRGQWVLALTADHGATPNVAVSGAVQLSIGVLQAAMEARFDTDGDDVPTIDKITQTGVFVNTDELRDNSGTLDDIASWLLGLKAGDVVDGGVSLTPEQARTPAFQAAFPSSVMADLPCLPEARA